MCLFKTVTMKTYIESYEENGTRFYLMCRNGIERFINVTQWNMVINQLSMDKVDYISQSPLGGFISIEYTL